MLKVNWLYVCGSIFWTLSPVLLVCWIPLGFPGGARGKEPFGQCGRYKRHEFNLWVCLGKIPWRRKWQPTLVVLAGESYGQRNLAGYSQQGCKEPDTTEAT